MEKPKRPKAIKPKKEDRPKGIPIYNTTPEGNLLCPFKANQKYRECLKHCTFNKNGRCIFASGGRKRKVGDERPLCPFFKRCAVTCAMNSGGTCGLAETIKSIR